MRSALQRWFSRPRAPLGVVAVALLLASPSLTVGLAADDFFHRIILTGAQGLPWVPEGLGGLFVWADGDPKHGWMFMDVGLVGWWSDPALKLAYARPITALTHVLDYALWPETPLLMHVHSLLWFALGLWALGRLYRRVQVPVGGTLLAVLSLCLFAIDDAHGLTISWLANRNALIVLFFGALCLDTHVRASTEQHSPSRIVSPLLLACALGSGEAAVAFCGYLGAYALLLDPRGPRRGLLALSPHVGVAVLWAGIYRALGYGASGSGLVVDPVAEPGRFLAMAAVRLPVLLAAQLGIPPADLWEFYGTVQPWLPAVMLGFVVLFVAAVAWLALPLLRERPEARFWAAGTVLSALPVCAQFAHDRLLMMVGIGGMGLMGMLLSAWLANERPPWVRSGRLSLLWALAFMHLLMGPMLLPLRARAPSDIARMVASADASIDSDPGVAERTVVLVNPPVDAYAGYVPIVRVATARPRPAHLHWLATGVSSVAITREDERTLRVRPADGFLSMSSERMQRGDAPMPVGYRVELTEMDVEVTEVGPDGRPAEARMTFRVPLEHDRLRFMHWEDGAFRPFALPAVGERVTTDAVDLAGLLPE